MKIEEISARIAAGSLGRRELGRLLAGAGLALVTLPVRSARPRAGSDLKYFGWGGYDDDMFHREFAEKHGGPPDFTFWTSEDEAFRWLIERGHTADVMTPCSYDIAKWHNAGLLGPLDTARLEHLGDLFPILRDIAGTVVAGKRYFMPLDWGNATVVCRTDLIDADYAESPSWEILFDERYKGRLAMRDSAGAVVEVAALTLGYENVFALTDRQLAKVRRKVAGQRDLLRFYWSSSEEATDALAAGDIVASYAWNDSYVSLREIGVPVGLMVPREGVFTWCCGLVMHARTERADAAYDLINGMTSPESGAAQIAAWGFGHANRKSFDVLPAEELDMLGLSAPDALLGNSIIYENLAPGIEDKYVRLFTEVVKGS